MAARIRIPLREHRPNHLAMQRTLKNNYYYKAELVRPNHLVMKWTLIKHTHTQAELESERCVNERALEAEGNLINNLLLIIISNIN